MHERRGQELERYLALQPGVDGQIDLAHAAFAQRRDLFVLPEPLSRRQHLAFAKQMTDRRFHECSVCVVGRKQRRYFPADFLVTRAGWAEKVGSLDWAKLQRSFENIFNLLPTFVVHLYYPPISRRSQARATLQSRFTVFGETLSTAAVSSTLKPLKKRSSTTRACCGSIFANLCNASSIAIRSRSVSFVTASDSSSVNLTCEPPRFSASRRRA